MELDRTLTEEQKDKLREQLSISIHDKRNMHLDDMRRAAVILYRVNQLGFTGILVMELLGNEYSTEMKQVLQNMSDAFTALIFGQNNYENEFLKNLEL
jgi:hypothetical protein